jgi:hypothetical protein
LFEEDRPKQECRAVIRQELKSISHLIDQRTVKETECPSPYYDVRSFATEREH